MLNGKMEHLPRRKSKKKFLGEYFKTNHKKLFTKLWIERELIEELEKKLVLPINSKESESITVPFFKAERLKRQLSQEQFAEKVGITVYHLRVLETGYRTLPHTKELVAKEAIAKYLGIDSSQVSIPTVIPDGLEKIFVGERFIEASHFSKNKY